MKRALFLFILLACSATAKAQDSDPDLISRHRPGFAWYYTGINPPEVERDRKYDRLIVDVLYNDWTGKSVKPFKVSPLSIGFNTNLLFDIPMAKNNTVSLGIGLAYGIYHIRMNDYFVRDEPTQSTKLTTDIKQFGIDKSTCNINSISLPLELRFRGKNWKHAKFQIGGRISWQFRATSSLTDIQNGIKHQQKTIGFYDLNPLNASAHVRFGIRNWALYASYNFMPYFKSVQSTQLNGLQFGLSISLF